MNKLALVDIRGEEHLTHEFDNLSIQHADVLPDGACVLLAAEVSQAPDGLKPISASPARKLIVFNLITDKVEHEVPLWYNVQYVTVSQSGQMVIVTYKGDYPPQLWRLRRTPSEIRLTLDRQFCARERGSALEFDPKRRIQFSGKGHFLNNDRFVLCATTEGKIHFWRRDRAEPIHILGDMTADKDRPVEIACHRASDNFMFATRSQDGTVRIWKAGDLTPTVTRVDMNGFAPQTTLSGLSESESPQMGTLALPSLPEESQASIDVDEAT